MKHYLLSITDDDLLIGIPIILVSILLIIFIGKALVNFWHKIDDRNKLLESQLYILILMAKERGLSDDKINLAIKNTQTNDNTFGERVLLTELKETKNKKP